MSLLNTPRYLTAKSTLPGDPLFWETVLDQSDVFATGTVLADKGGPFGAQLWLVHPDTNKYILIGEANNAEDSNAVLLKGIAGAHAEAENLSPEKRLQVVDELRRDGGDGWHVVQISSGESCPSCRSKQVLFATELVTLGLIKRGNFHVAFKATYDQTKIDAGFNDAPYDQTFRAISMLRILGTAGGLKNLEAALKRDETTSSMLSSGEIIYNPVSDVTAADIPSAVNGFFASAGNTPMAVIVRPNDLIMSVGRDTRDSDRDIINMPEKTAIVAALYKAAMRQRQDEGKPDSWDLEGARLYTNITDIGPTAYSESLWYNLSAIHIVRDYASFALNTVAWEVRGTDNRELFARVAAEYGDAISPLKVAFNGNPAVASAAHLQWKAKMALEKVKKLQATRLESLEGTKGQRTVRYIGGEPLVLSDFVAFSRTNSNYDGKQAKPAPEPENT